MQSLNFKFFLKIFFLLFLPFNFAWAENEVLPESFFENNLEKINLIIKKEKETVSKDVLFSWIKETPKLEINSTYYSEIENPNFCLYQKSILCRLSFSFQNENHVQKKYTRHINEEALQKYLSLLGKKYNREPKNAKMKIVNGKVSAFSLSSPGIKIKEEEALKKIRENLILGLTQDDLVLELEEISPEISSDSIENLGITNLIGQGKSNFKGSSVNRIFNINVALKHFDGLLIKPQEEFSFVKNLGEVDKSTGYRPELVIKKDKTELDYGGGVCQVSTTIFRAAINSGLKITARRNHAYAVSYYYPHGMDATIYVPLPDLKFKNNTPAHILVETKIEGTELTLNFYGTDDGRKVNVIGPEITEKNSDGSMKTIFTQQVFDKDNRIILEDSFRSSYDSPNNYPHPESSILTKKPEGWSKKEWDIYKKNHDL